MKLFKNDETGTWFVTFMSDTGEQSVNTGADTREKAEDICRLAKIEQLEKAAMVGRLTAETITRLTAGHRVSMEEAAQKYAEWITAERSASTASSNLSIIGAFIRDMNLADVTPAQVKTEIVTKFINRTELKLSTRKIQRSVLVGFFDYCTASGWLIGNPASRAVIHYNEIPIEGKERKRKELFEPAEVKFLINSLEGFWRAAVILSSELGLRLSDVSQLEWKSFDFKTKKVVIWMDKTNQRIELDMTPAVQRLMVSLPQTDKRFVFPEEKATNQSTLSWQFKRACEKLGFEGRSFHCLRATYATDEYLKQVEGSDAMKAVAAKLGHKSTTTTAKHYVKT